MDSFQEQIATLEAVFRQNGVPTIPIPAQTQTEAEAIYNELLKGGKSRIKPATMRSLVRLFVSREAYQIQITNPNVISRVADSLLETATYQEKLTYQNLAAKVTAKINAHHIQHV